MEATQPPSGGGQQAASVPLNVDALQQITPTLVKMQDVLKAAGRKYNRLGADCKTLVLHLEELVKHPPQPPRSKPKLQRLDTPPADVPRMAPTEGAAEPTGASQGGGNPDLPSGAAALVRSDPDIPSPAREVPEAKEDAAAAEGAPPVPAPAPEAVPSPPAPEAGDAAAEEGGAGGAADGEEAAAAAEEQEPAKEGKGEAEGGAEAQAASGEDDSSPQSDVPQLSQPNEELGDQADGKAEEPPPSNLERSKSRLEELLHGEIPAEEFNPNSIVAMEIMDFLRQCIDTKRPTIVGISLECLHRLVMYKLVHGQCSLINGKKGGGGEAEEGGSGSGAGSAEAEITPPSVAVELYCKCEDIPDDNVELQVMKGLLTCVTSLTITVHGQALLLAVRCCYNIYLTSRSEVNQATAKASLTQMVNVVFQRMEANSVVVQVNPIVVSDILGVPPSTMVDTSSVASTVQMFLNKVVDDFSAQPADVDAYREGLHAAFDDEHTAAGEEPVAEDPLSPDRDHIEWRAGEEGPPGDGGEQQRPDEGSTEGKEPSAAAAPPSQRTLGKPVPISVPQSAPSTNVLQKDAFLVFRALCKLSIKTSEGGQGADPMAIKGKVLALELLKVLLENSGPVFCRSEKFVSALKQYLCLSLLKNCAGSSPQAQRLSCSLFLTLVRKFRQSLKAEVGVFFPMILLRALEPIGGSGPNSGTAAAASNPPVNNTQMHVILKCLKEQCSDGQLLVDLFVNYDCDLEGSNIFERMVAGLVRVAQGHAAEKEGKQQHHPENEILLQTMATECLASILQSLVVWHKDGAPVQQEEGEGDEDGAAAESDVSPDASVRAAALSFRNKSAGELCDGDQGEGARQWESVESKKAYKLGFQEGIALFNTKPKKGIKFMQEHGMLGTSPEDIATFLAKTSGLNKTMIGDYLGEREDTALKVMHAYCDAMDFDGMAIDDAIRKFLADFRLPGEAQKIDRLMEKFAERYFLDNPGNAFKSADVAYVLAFSVIMLNTDAHNPMVKNKMTKKGFVNNNRGINDGHDLPEEYLQELYDRIAHNEIKMKDTDPMESMKAASSTNNAKGWVDTVMGLIGTKKVDTMEPSDDAIRRTHEYLKEKAKGATFFTATDGETVRPMVEVAWAPMLGAFSVLFEDNSVPGSELYKLCLDGFLHAITLTSSQGMTMLRDTYVTSLSRLTNLHTPGNMSIKSAHALRTLITAAEINGNTFQGAWPEVLRCISKFDLLVQQHSGAPGDNVLFAPPGVTPPSPVAEKSRRKLFNFGRQPAQNPASDVGPMSDTDSTMREQREVITKDAEGSALSFANMSLMMTTPSVRPPKGPQGLGELMPAPPPGVLEVIDGQELNRLFVLSDRLNSTAIVEFVMALSAVSQQELANAAHPRVFGLTKIVEIAHFNMTRIRLVWNRIWAVLSDYFITVGCHQNLSVAIFAVDSLRQLAMKFLERDELANYTFQNDFLRPFVVVMRQSNSLEIRELIIRCVSQMVLARVANVKSGWKSMFMVFTTAAQDDAQTIVRLSFETIEKIVREHFAHITETEITTFTDCVNCLIAFTNNPHSLDVALNAIAFLRFCAMKLADGAIGSVDELPEESLKVLEGSAEDIAKPPLSIKCIDSKEHPGETPVAVLAGSAALQSEFSEAVSLPGGLSSRATSGRLHFTDKDEHMYFWFPLLAGLSELTFDPRPDIRYSALEVLFDILRYHGKCFSGSFWARVFDSVIFPIFDHVRAEVTDTTTFTDDRRRADEDKWLYDTCTKCLQHLVDLFCHFFPVVHPMLGRLLDLLAGFIYRTHQSLAAVGVAALVRLISDCGPLMDASQWVQTMGVVRSSAIETMPQVADLVWTPPSPLDLNSSADYDDGGAGGGPQQLREWTLGEGLGARRLAEVQCRTSVQLLLVQASGEVYARHCRRLPSSAIVVLLDVLRGISTHARSVDADVELRRALAQKQAADGVADHRAIHDPPLMKLESEASHSYLSVLLHINMAAEGSETKTSACVEERLVELCIANLLRYEAVSTAMSNGTGGDGSAKSNVAMTTSSSEHNVRGPLVVATLRALAALGDAEFRSHLHEFFPLLTRLISCQHAPVEVQRALSVLFEKRIGPLLQ